MFLWGIVLIAVELYRLAFFVGDFLIEQSFFYIIKLRFEHGNLVGSTKLKIIAFTVRGGLQN